MNGLIGVIILLFIGIGLFVNILGVIGLYRFPDVYTRLHAETKMTTFGAIFLTFSVIIYGLAMLWDGGGSEYITLSVHTFIAILALAFTNATGAHAIARAAHRSGEKPVSVVDRLEEADL